MRQRAVVGAQAQEALADEALGLGEGDLAARDEEVREAGEFFACVTAVREALRGRRVPGPPAGADLR